MAQGYTDHQCPATAFPSGHPTGRESLDSPGQVRVVPGYYALPIAELIIAIANSALVTIGCYPLPDETA